MELSSISGQGVVLIDYVWNSAIRCFSGQRVSTVLVAVDRSETDREFFIFVRGCIVSHSAAR